MTYNRHLWAQPVEFEYVFDFGCVIMLVDLILVSLLFQAGQVLRNNFDQKCRLLRQQESRGENTDKIRAGVKDLHSRIGVAIHRINSISKKIEEIRDTELQPQLEELIEGYIRFSILICHFIITFFPLIELTSCYWWQIKEDVGNDVGMPQASVSRHIYISDPRKCKDHRTLRYTKTDHDPSRERTQRLIIHLH